MNRVMLYFGSFNPIHNGHTAIAGWVAGRGLVDQVWMVCSPQNPLRDDLVSDEDRLAMARIAVDEQLQGAAVRVSDVEFGLSKPSYTIDTLRFLGREYPDTEFSILAGADILAQLPGWKESGRLLADYRFYIYPRDGYSTAEGISGEILVDAPRWDFSSTDVRRALMEGGEVGEMVSPGVAEYIEKHGLWRPTTTGGWLARGRRLSRQGQMGEALNAFLHASELDPTNDEAAERVKMLREIFAFRHLDYYNP